MARFRLRALCQSRSLWATISSSKDSELALESDVELWSHLFVAELNLSISTTSTPSGISLTLECHRDQSWDLFCLLPMFLKSSGEMALGSNNTQTTHAYEHQLEGG